jgi:N-acetylglucosaminyldiphosphoundecaprenol N-acetyl-beta-D-mannosaminyltransferase
VVETRSLDRASENLVSLYSDTRGDLVRNTRSPAEFLGFAFDCIDPAIALKRILAREAKAPFAYIITPNVDHVVRLQCARSDLWPAYRHAWLTLCDSRVLSKLAASVRVHLPVTTGSDLTASMFHSGMAGDDRIAVVGGDPAMVDMLRKRGGFTNLVHYNPPMGFINDPLQRLLAVDFVVNARARFTFLAVGSPQQEILAYEVARGGEAVGVGLCVGASLEFITGSKVRAPQIFQLFAMEWLFRLATDPARLWRRYLIDGPLIFSIFRHWRTFIRPWS